MKLFLVITTGMLLICACKQHRLNNGTEQSFYKVVSEDSISLGYHNSIVKRQPLPDGNFLFYLLVTDGGTKPAYKYFSLKLSPSGETIEPASVIANPFPFISDYKETPDAIYSVITYRNTMNGVFNDSLKKYDKNKKLSWSKKINGLKMPDGTTPFLITEKNEILLATDEYNTKQKTEGFAIRRYDLDGKLIAEKIYPGNDFSQPQKIMVLTNRQFLLTVLDYDTTTKTESTRLVKLNSNGDTLWTKKYKHITTGQVIETKDQKLLMYGEAHTLSDKATENESFLKAILVDTSGNTQWVRSIKRLFYDKQGNVIETANGHFMFSGSVRSSNEGGGKAILFELDENGNSSFEKIFNHPLGISSVPFVMKNKDGITMVSQKWIGKSGEPFHDLIWINRLK